MRRIRTHTSLRLVVLAGGLLIGILATTVLARTVLHRTPSAHSSAYRTLATPGNESDEAQALAQLDSYWSERLTYPTGRYNGLWLRRAAAQDENVRRDVPSPSDNGATSGTGSGG